MTTVWANVVYLLTWPYFAVVLLLLPLVCFFFLLALVLVVLPLLPTCYCVLLFISNSIFSIRNSNVNKPQSPYWIMHSFAPVCAHFSIVYIFILQISICTHIRTHTRPHWRAALFAGFSCSFMAESTLTAKIKIKKTTSERHVQC